MGKKPGGGGKGGAGQIDAPDPSEIIGQQLEHNRIDQITPFGSSTFDENGNQVISATPGMQGLIDRSIGLAGQDAQRFQMPDFISQLGNALAQKVGGNLGVDVSPHNKPQQSAPPMPQMSGDPAYPQMNAAPPQPPQIPPQAMFGGGGFAGGGNRNPAPNQVGRGGNSAQPVAMDVLSQLIARTN